MIQVVIAKKYDESTSKQFDISFLQYFILKCIIGPQDQRKKRKKRRAESEREKHP